MRILPVRLVVSLFLAVHCFGAEVAPLKFITYPGGGQIVYGPLSNVNSLGQAMGFMLKTVHGKFGNRPEVGNMFQTRGSNSVATFFTVTSSRDNRQVTGMVIVSVPQNGQPAAALLFDESQRFRTNADGMMKKLNEAWHPDDGPAGKPSTSRVAVAAALHETSFPDNSGSVGLPDGWRITAGGQGAVHAEGPNGSEISYGIVVPVMDPTNPQTRQMIEMETQGGRMPLPGSYVAYPAGGDPVRTLMAVSGMVSQKSRRPAATYNAENTKDMGDSPGGRCTFTSGQLDRHDGKGAVSTAMSFCMTRPMNGLWMLTVYQNIARLDAPAQETATLEAIAKSYKVNNAVVARETQDTIDAIHRIGDESMRRAADSNAAFERRNAAMADAEKGRDQHNSDFSNYLLGQTVIRDTQTGEHATGYNQYADALVKADPNRYQYVPTKDLLRGIDY